MINSFMLALQFLTSIPVKTKTVKLRDLPESVTYYPVVGLVLGLILALCFYVLDLFFSVYVSSILLTGIYILLTGALHLDGFADTVDGLYGGRTKKDIFRIMADSATGAKGAAWLALLLILKIALIATLASKNIYPALVLFPVLGRFAITILMKFSKYAKKDGLGKVFCGKIGNLQFTGIIIIVTILSLMCGPVGLYSLLGVVLASIIIKNHFGKKIGGVTGDIFGFTLEVTEAAVLLLFVAKL